MAECLIAAALPPKAAVEKFDPQASRFDDNSTPGAAAAVAGMRAAYAVRDRLVAAAGRPTVRIAWPDGVPKDARRTLTAQLEGELSRIWVEQIALVTRTAIEAASDGCCASMTALAAQAVKPPKVV